MALEDRFDTTFISGLAHREKQIQQAYRPVIGVHKWFARRPGTLFRGLLLAEFGEGSLPEDFFRGHDFRDKVIADPFMGGGTPLIEANRLGMKVIGSDINPMAYWIVRQSLAPLDLEGFISEAKRVAATVEEELGHLYQTECKECGSQAVVKYFLWVKSYDCTACGKANDLFPGHMIAANARHPAFVWYCPGCEQLAEIPRRPSTNEPVNCPHCENPLPVRAVARRGRYECSHCGEPNQYPTEQTPRHRLFAMEYHCAHCRSQHKGRYFKVPSMTDLDRFAEAERELASTSASLIPDDAIPVGDETRRLHRWGYRRYRELFNDRQLLVLHTLLRSVADVKDREMRLALTTVFSDMLRYQNMLCRYDTTALKCQDIFSVHGFPVGLIQCENNPIGVDGVGGGGFRHFVDKYVRAKEYCEKPFEVMMGHRRRRRYTEGEAIRANLVSTHEGLDARDAYIAARDSSALRIGAETLDGVFTDPPYFDNVQYAELMDFCYVWIRKVLAREDAAFAAPSTRHAGELTGNNTMGRGLSEFAEGISSIFCKTAVGLKSGAPLVFTYHHNRADAYLPLIVAILDAGLTCTDTLASPAEMTASIHINGTSSSVIDSIFVCRKDHRKGPLPIRAMPDCLVEDIANIRRAGVHVTKGDIVCMTLGHLSRLAVESLSTSWDPELTIEERLDTARAALEFLISKYPPDRLADQLFEPKAADEERAVVQYALSFWAESRRARTTY